MTCEQCESEVDSSFVVPDNFSLVLPGIYRSCYPIQKNFAFMETLRLTSVLTLVRESYDLKNLDFNRENNIRVIQIPISGNKEPFVNISVQGIRNALTELLDVRNHPILVHCQNGKHRTGCLIGVLRKMIGWKYCSIIEEYIKFSTPKERFMDKEFIELFDVGRVRLRINHLPAWFTQIYNQEDMRKVHRRVALPQVSSVQSMKTINNSSGNLKALQSLQTAYKSNDRQTEEKVKNCSHRSIALKV